MSGAICKYLEAPKCCNPLKIQPGWIPAEMDGIIYCSAHRQRIELNPISTVSWRTTPAKFNTVTEISMVMYWVWFEIESINDCINNIPNTVQHFGCIKQVWESNNTGKVINSLLELCYALKKPFFGEKRLSYMLFCLLYGRRCHWLPELWKSPRSRISHVSKLKFLVGFLKAQT